MELLAEAICGQLFPSQRKADDAAVTGHELLGEPVRPVTTTPVQARSRWLDKERPSLPVSS